MNCVLKVESQVKTVLGGSGCPDNFLFRGNDLDCADEHQSPIIVGPGLVQSIGSAQPFRAQACKGLHGELSKRQSDFEKL